jgi:hypothetical protein
MMINIGIVVMSATVMMLVIVSGDDNSVENEDDYHIAVAEFYIDDNGYINDNADNGKC